MLRFAVLGSGSRGNASVVSDGETTLMIDCGFSRRETEARLAQIGLAPEAVTALLVTHEHSDHVAGVARFARHHGVPVYATHGTVRAAGLEALEGLRPIAVHEAFAVGGLSVQPYPVPHDAAEPAQFVIGRDAIRLGVLSDSGSVTAHMREVLDGCDGLLLECNHCPDMLAAGPYPPALKQRVGGNFGHLSNGQSAALLSQLDHRRLQRLVITHISEKNNCPDRARSALVEALGHEPDWLEPACQDQPLGWRELN